MSVHFEHVAERWRQGRTYSLYVRNQTLAAELSWMPKYFFNVFHDRTEWDSVGEELPDQHAAWKEATVTAGQLLQSLDGKLQPDQDWRMEVTDEFANPLYVIHVSAKRPL